LITESFNISSYWQNAVVVNGKLLIIGG